VQCALRRSAEMEVLSGILPDRPDLIGVEQTVMEWPNTESTFRLQIASKEKR
jgi:hypothetical protein